MNNDETNTAQDQMEMDTEMTNIGMLPVPSMPIDQGKMTRTKPTYWILNLSRSTSQIETSEDGWAPLEFNDIKDAESHIATLVDEGLYCVVRKLSMLSVETVKTISRI